MNPKQKFPNLAQKGAPINQQPPEMMSEVSPEEFAQPQQEMANPQEIADLHHFFDEMDKKVQNLIIRQKAIDDIDYKENQKVLNQLFEEMSKRGVDLTDPASVSDFLQQLNSANPEVGEHFQFILEYFMKEMGGGDQTQEDPNAQIPQDPNSPLPPQPPVDTTIPPNLGNTEPQSPPEMGTNQNAPYSAF